jgi:hypothetical protein
MRRLAVLLLALGALAGCGGSDGEESAPASTVTPAGGVKPLDNVLALRSDFEAQAGKTRVILLLSPT